MPNVFDEPCKGCPFYGAQHPPVKDKKQPLSLEDNKSKILLMFNLQVLKSGATKSLLWASLFWKIICI